MNATCQLIVGRSIFLPHRNVTYVPAKIVTIIGVTADAYRFTAF